MRSSVPRGLQAEAGFTLVELVVTTFILVILMAGLSNIFISGSRANADANARMSSQQNVRLAFDRLEYDARCAQTATLQGGGSGIAFSIPTWCAHATGNVAWCVQSGSLIRIAATSCNGTGQTLVNYVTSATPFSCYSTGVSGALPLVKVNLTVNTTPRTANKTTASDWITMRNASSSGACS